MKYELNFDGKFDDSGYQKFCQDMQGIFGGNRDQPHLIELMLTPAEQYVVELKLSLKNLGLLLVQITLVMLRRLKTSQLKM